MKFIILQDNMDLNTQLFYFINNGLSNPYFDFIMPHLTDIGGISFYACLFIVLLLITRKDMFGLKKYYPLVKLCICSLLLCVLITACLKLFFSSPRPSLVLEHANVLTSSYDPNSFPSGHTATTLSIMTVLFLKAKEYFNNGNLIMGLAVAYAIMIAFSRIYIGMHFPFDVLIGGVIGMVSGVVVVKCLKV